MGTTTRNPGIYTAPIGEIPSAFVTVVRNFCGVWFVDHNTRLLVNRTPTSFVVLHTPQI